ncbi:M43 family zinc metalloprotease [Hyalangium gracile]|uniref:M43 family zinc metalloprotease n=1 Tax=Hyalangium gracile TaxID=394092 RepID=UPI001CC937A2|nr:M43 family zinc metalloprotease [Hyalangium gracile]
MNEELSPGRLRVEVSRTLHLAEVGLEPLSFSPGKMHSLMRILEMSRTHPAGGSPDALEVPVIFAGCLLEKEPLFHVRHRPLGRVTHIPGGFNTAESADGIFLAGTHCDPRGSRFNWPATTVARLLAHELGHFLGLYHSIEQDGTEDALSDTGKDNAMHFNPLMSTARGFSPSQFQVMRRHPMVTAPAVH